MLNPLRAFTAWALLLLETIFTICLIATSYRLFGSGWGDLDILNQLNWSWLASQPLNGLGEWIPMLECNDVNQVCFFQLLF
jgi:hypothetical protein